MVYAKFYKVKETARINDTGERQVDQKASKGDGHKEQRLKALRNGEIEQDEGDEQHNKRRPVQRNKS